MEKIKKGDYVFITDGQTWISKNLFGRKFLCMKPNKFYRVLGLNDKSVFLTCEPNAGKFTRIKLESPILEKLTFIGEEDFKEIENLDFFEYAL